MVSIGTETVTQFIDLLFGYKQDSIKAEKKRGHSKAAEAKQFMNSYKVKRQQVREDAAKASGKKAPAVVRRALPHRVFTLSQSEVARLGPPGSSVWQARQKGGWMGHLPPFKRVSAMWSDFGEERSPIVLLQKLCHLYLIVEGFDEDACPHTGVFPARA